MKDNELKIARVDNGFVVTTMEYRHDNQPVPIVTVFQDSETDYGDRDSGYEMLWHILEHFGLRGSKHDVLRLTIHKEPHVDFD